MHRLRNFVMRLSIHYILFSILLLLRGISRDQQLFGVWIVAFVFTLLSVSLRRVLLTLALPLIIMTGGLFIFVVDVILLALTATFTRLNVANFWWALLGVIVMSTANIWIERAFRDLGWLRDSEPGQGNVLTRPSPPWWVRLTLFAVLLFGIGFSFAMATQLFLLTSRLTTNMIAIAVIACVGFACFSWGIAWLVAHGLALSRRARFSIVATLVLTIAIAVPAAVIILVTPPLDAAAETVTGPHTEFWTLPTGSEIAYTHVPAASSLRVRNPIVVLHGLGEATLAAEIAFFGQLSESGHDVYLYDMVGSGDSSRLGNIEGYTLDRHVADLEAIREHIDGDRLILIAHAEGAEVAGWYMIGHRDRVERVVFYGPSALWARQTFARDTTRTGASPVNTLAGLDVRSTVALAVAYYSPRTAQAYMPQAELTAWADRTVDEGTMVCLGNAALAPDPEAPGYNPYVEIVGRISAQRMGDPRPELAKLLIPTILVRGECDPVDSAVVWQYQEALPFLQTIRIEGAGGMPHLEKPETVKEILLDFIMEQTVPE
ncbi:MAG: alpha/beta fold hydrolase [Anaerolineae bacterium]|nr:alpha/beta fold hydrolase [Anaerolineae bacterium]